MEEKWDAKANEDCKEAVKKNRNEAMCAFKS